MRNLFLDDFTNTIRDEILQKRETAKEYDAEQDYSAAASRLDRECHVFWWSLMQYYLIVLKRRRFMYQQIHAASVLEKLDEQGWKIWTSRKKRKKKTQQDGDSFESN